jgi:hypothetical protein
MGSMGTRAHVYVALIATSGLATGCIFGGKKKPPTMETFQAPRAGAYSGAVRPPTDDLAATEGLATRQGRPKAAADALPPKETAVTWPKAEELSLTGRDTAVPQQPTAPQPPAEHELVPPPPRQLQRSAAAHADHGHTLAARQPEAPAAELTAEPSAPAKTPGDAAANAELALTDADNHPAPSAGAASVVQTAASSEVAASAASDELSRRVAQRLRDNPGDLASHLDYQLARFLRGDSVPDLNALTTLSAEDREVVTALMDGLSNFRNGVRSDQNMLLSKKIRPLLEAAARLRSQAELSIPTIALCQRVGGFGMYEPMDGRFVAGQRNATIVYCEVGNVSSQQNEQGEWVSQLSQEAVLYTEGGVPVWSSPRQTVPDRARNRRHDFFVRQKIVLPPNLSIARYILKVTLTDEQVKRVAEATVPITMVAALDAQPPAPQQPAPQQPIANPTGAGQADDARTAAERQRLQGPGAGVTRLPAETVDAK